tara:strand:- start:202 stop:384 length:183 start_codon:yes stop_codon:yes gene_type:complete
MKELKKQMKELKEGLIINMDDHLNLEKKIDVQINKIESQFLTLQDNNAFYGPLVLQKDLH